MPLVYLYANNDFIIITYEQEHFQKCLSFAARRFLTDENPTENESKCYGRFIMNGTIKRLSLIVHEASCVEM